MNSVFYLTTMLEDDDEGEIHNNRYICAVTQEEAIAQGQKIFGSNADFGCHEIAENEWNDDLALDCIRDTLDDLGSDALMLFALKKFPDFIDADLISEILWGDFPQSFKFALDTIFVSDCRSKWIELALEHQDQKSLQLLLDKGVRDDGGGLAQTCDDENRFFFDLLYPYSNPHKALEQTNFKNLHWIEECLAEEQKQRIDQHMTTPTQTRQRKM